MTNTPDPQIDGRTFTEKVRDAIRAARPIVAVGLMVVFMIASVIPDFTTKVAVLIALFSTLLFVLFDLYKQITDNVKEIKASLLDIGDGIKSIGSPMHSNIEDIKASLVDINEGIQNIEDPLYKAAFRSNLPTPEKQVAVRMYKASEEASNQLRQPISFPTHEAYTAALMGRIAKMISGGQGTINAACGKKAWENKLVRNWFEKNYEALGHNIVINRIFLEEACWSTEDAGDAIRQMNRQASEGINVRFAKLTAIQQMDVLRNVPDGFGFVIFDFGDNKPEVIVHDDPSIGRAVLFDNPMIVAQFTSTFHELNSDVYSDVIASNNEHDITISLKRVILDKADTMRSMVRQLVSDRYSNLHRDFVNWRLSTEVTKIDSLLKGEISLYALDRFAYLRDVFRQILRQLGDGHVYQTLSVVDFWSGDNIGSSPFLDATLEAMTRGAKMDRIVFVDKLKFEDENDVKYQLKVKSVIQLFESFGGKSHPNFKLRFFIGRPDGSYSELIKHAPLSLISEASGARLGITTRHAEPNAPNERDPFLHLEFYAKGLSERHSEAFRTGFEPMKEVSISVEELKTKLLDLYPPLADGWVSPIAKK